MESNNPEKKKKTRFTVIIAQNSGYCYGVKRAMEQTKIAASEKRKVYTLGPIIHNPQVVDALRKEGIEPIEKIEDVEEGVLILRTHGVEPKITRLAEDKGIQVIDSTCPFVKKAQQIAAELLNQGYSIVIVGEKDHPEVKSHFAYARYKASVIENEQDAKKFAPEKKVGVVVQTTQSPENLAKIVSLLVPKVQELKVFNTICNATSRMQEEAAKIAKRADVIFVVGGRNSANTTRLTKICSKITKTFHIETHEEIRSSMLPEDPKIIGIIGGASTPHTFLKNVEQEISRICSSLSDIPKQAAIKANGK